MKTDPWVKPLISWVLDPVVTFLKRCAGHSLMEAARRFGESHTWGTHERAPLNAFVHTVKLCSALERRPCATLVIGPVSGLSRDVTV